MFDLILLGLAFCSFTWINFASMLYLAKELMPSGLTSKWHLPLITIPGVNTLFALWIWFDRSWEREWLKILEDQFTNR